MLQHFKQLRGCQLGGAGSIVGHSSCSSSDDFEIRVKSQMVIFFSVVLRRQPGKCCLLLKKCNLSYLVWKLKLDTDLENQQYFYLDVEIGMPSLFWPF